MSVSSIVAAFGGTSRMAATFGVSPAAVSNWKASDHIPARWHYAISRYARRRRLKVDLSCFENEEEERASAALARVRALLNEAGDHVDTATLRRVIEDVQRGPPRR